MVYLDYSATTPVNKEVLKSFNKVCIDYVGNSNSLHKLGTESKSLETACTNQIKKILDVDHEIIYTSGASESNNLAIKGLIEKYESRGKHIITTNLEHSSIYAPIGYLQRKGYIVDFVNTNNGIIDIEDLEGKITDETVLVAINAVNSETGVIQDIAKIGKLLKNYKCFFLVDATQAVGKVKLDYKDVDMFSFSAHKFFGLKGIGVLAKKPTINLEPLIHGGKSTTKFRSGTPALPLIVSLAKALRLSYVDFSDKYNHVVSINNYIKEHLNKYEGVSINSKETSIPHILNISLEYSRPETLQHALEEDGVYISTGSACSSKNPVNKAVLEVTNSDLNARHAVRISISYVTTKEEADIFLAAFDKQYNRLKELK